MGRIHYLGIKEDEIVFLMKNEKFEMQLQNISEILYIDHCRYSLS